MQPRLLPQPMAQLRARMLLHHSPGSKGNRRTFVLDDSTKSSTLNQNGDACKTSN
jgi:hypothetical protein